MRLQKCFMTFLVGLVVFLTGFGPVQDCFSRLQSSQQDPIREDVADLFQDVLDEAGANAPSVRMNQLYRLAKRHTSLSAPAAIAPSETVERFIRAQIHPRSPPGDPHFKRGPPIAIPYD